MAAEVRARLHDILQQVREPCVSGGPLVNIRMINFIDFDSQMNESIMIYKINQPRERKLPIRRFIARAYTNPDLLRKHLVLLLLPYEQFSFTGKGRLFRLIFYMRWKSKIAYPIYQFFAFDPCIAIFQLGS